jgi:(p)ppGpp synthase/HD superfamily hydrolase
MHNLKSCFYSLRLIKKLESIDTNNSLDFAQINKAIYWAIKYHGDQTRLTGEPFYSHPLEVAYMVSTHLLKTDVIIASILHDIVEDTQVTIQMILDEFGPRVAKMVDMLTRDRPDGTKLTVEEILNNAFKQGDKEIILIKILDRQHNLETSSVKTREKQLALVQKTLKNFLIIAEFTEFTPVSKNVYNKCLALKEMLQETNPLVKLDQEFLNTDFTLPPIPSSEKN